MAKNNGSNMNDMKNAGDMDMNNMQSQNKSGNNKKGSNAGSNKKGGATNSK